MTGRSRHERTLDLGEVTRLGRQLRADSIRLADAAGSGHPTSSMSAADLVAVLISSHLVLDVERPDDLANDRMVFSKGHASPLLYSALAAVGILSDQDLDGYRKNGSPLEGHPTPRVPTVPVATGALGLGLPIAGGLALAARDLDRTDSHIWVLCGDGELAEGAMWEAIDDAGARGLGNLQAIIDVNRLGQTGPTRYGWNAAHYANRFTACGWHVTTIDGHDVEQIDSAYRQALADPRPSAILAVTHKGSGVTETDDVEGKHGKPLDDPESAVEELGNPQRMIVSIPKPPTDSVARPSRSRHGDFPQPQWELGQEVATRDAFGEALDSLASVRGDLVLIDGDVANSTRLDTACANVSGERFIQAFIAEQLMFSIATGVQVTGWKPVAATFGAFSSRAHDVLRMAAVSGADICVVGSHAGVSIGADGPSQMALEDLAMMRSIHGSTVIHPCDANQTAALLPKLLDQSGIAYMRTLRGATQVIYRPEQSFEIGGSVMIRSHPDDRATVIGAGVTTHQACRAADQLRASGIHVAVIDAYSVKPLDKRTIVDAAVRTGNLLVVEDHRPEGGLGEAVATAVLEADAGPVRFRHLAVRTMPGSATPEEQRRGAQIDSLSITETLEGLVDA